MDNVWEDLSRVLIKRRGIQRVLNYRNPNRVSREKQETFIVKEADLTYWDTLLLKYGGMSDDDLKERLMLIELEIDFELDKVFRYY
jgi:hypothetical protein